MLKFTKLLIPILCIHLSTLAQPRHVQGMDMLGLLAGTGPGANTLGASYQKYFTSDISVKVDAGLSWIRFPLSQDRSFFLQPQILYSLFSNKRQFYLNAAGGVFSGIESLNNSMFTQNINNLFVGESFGLVFEYFLTSLLKVELGWEQLFLQHSKIADYQYRIKLGTYFNF